MTREEQIVKASRDAEKQMGLPMGASCYGIGYLDGALWADEHPDLYSVTRKAVERERKLIDKACKWITQHIEDERYKMPDEESYRHGQPYDYFETNMFIDDFRKAMEEQQ